MFDTQLRPWKDRLLDPLASRLDRAGAPSLLTGLSLTSGVAAGVAAGYGAIVWSLALWAVSRLADGLDGAVARQTGTAHDLGGYLDMLADSVVYAAIPLGVAAASGEARVWAAAAILIASFYVNAISWAYLSALLEKRGRGADAMAAPTSVRMPPGLVEGTETMLLYTLMLALPGQAVVWFWLMAVLVALTVVQRLRWASIHLPRHDHRASRADRR
jgi:phosphatidylglycerophosphate synthase